MPNIVLLDNVDHHDLRIKPGRGAAYGDNINQTLVFPNEFCELQREYPIFFRKDEQDEFQAVAMLGLDRDENLFLKDEAWDARYMPAVQARGPFSIGLKQAPDGSAGEPVIRVDMDSPAVGAEDGYPVFLPQGGYSPYLEQIINVLRALHEGVDRSKAFFAALETLDLIEPVAVEIKISDTKQYSVPNVFSISEEKFHGLSPENLSKLHQSGFLAECYFVLSSLGNVNALVERKTRAEQG